MSHASESHGIVLNDFKDHIKDLWEDLLNERFVFSFRNSLKISAYRKLETEYRKWSWSLRSAMMESENKLYNKIENEAIHEVEETDLHRELKETREEVKKSMSELFEKDRDKDILIQWKTSFEIKIKELQENIVRETKRKLNAILQQRDLKKKIDAQRTHHENTLCEKSKELTFKLRDKANDGETLKKEFDLFWKQWMKMIIRTTPAVRDIDIMRDVREILSDVYDSLPVGYWRESRDIFTVSSYSDYVKLKKPSGIDASQIRYFVTDVAQQTDTIIQSFNISKMGYNISCIQLLTDYIKTRQKHEEGQVNYVFKNEFFIDLVLSICKRANKKITDQHRLSREANDPVIYVEKEREEYYSVFLKYCHGAASAAIFGKIICEKLKELIEQSVYKKTARYLANYMRTDCQSLNGNRSNLEKHILKTLAEEEDFNKYMNYIHNTRDHYKSFIRDEVRRYITDQFSVSVLPKMKDNIKLLQQKIMKAAHKLEEVIRKELAAIMSDISCRFNTKSFPVNLDYKFRPDELLIDHFCQCCWVQCPFCKAICTNTIENHPGDHSVAFHRVTGINGYLYRGTTNLCINICTTAVVSDRWLYPDGSDDKVPWKEYRRAGGVYAYWSITPDVSELPYWKWFVCRFQRDLEKYYMKTFQGCGKIPHAWRRYSKQDAIESLDKCL
ncbi:interferon-induced very large GTPase 1-like [Sinocyclocheilus rhinocerous]|uniref:interferon-induced very large GTPase 1-like n=1 Tax=Sinocyclocheilus rhinocerous TaxID=307959 RepID=UPI0007B8240C|nr:PREDICTED: interferon-induced very large GTPase 1-like [Sinocyclocheilus rhinocerous]